ncbi:MAG: hypothetical protein SGPRY_009847, partial [Prymnesium sp.]
LPSTSPTRGLEQLITFPRANARRQECAHAHMVKMWTRGSVPSVLVADLGSDCVWTLAYEAEAQTPLRVWPLALLELKLAQLRLMQSQVHPDPAIAVAYVAFELTSQVAAFSIDESGALGEPLPPGPICTLAVSDVTTMPKPFAVDSDTSDAIKSVEVLSISGLTRTLGKVPRDFILLPSVNSTEHRYFALVANQDPVSITAWRISCVQDSDNIVVLSSTAPATDLNARVPTPVSLCVVPELVLDA